MEIPINEMTWGQLLLLLCLSRLLCSGLKVTQVALDSPDACSVSPRTYWASEQNAIIVTGRGSEEYPRSLDCSVIVGAATVKSSVLQLCFEAFHIRDCGVVFAVNQSSNSDFSPDNSVLAKLDCNHGNIKVLHSDEKHFVKISVRKDDAKLLKYNFRINITVTDRRDKRLQCSGMDQLDPNSDKSLGTLSDSEFAYRWEANYLNHTDSLNDKVSDSGDLELHVVIIVGIVILVIVGGALWLLVKHIMLRTKRMNEQRAERNMERAIHLYNNIEVPPEPDYMYTALPLPPPEVNFNRRVTALQRNGHGQRNQSSSRGGRQRAGDITFVHVDGHIETFRMHDSNQGDHPAQTTTTQRAKPAPGAGDGADYVEGENQGEDNMVDCPPSYEEALHMPSPQSSRSPLYVNLNSKTNDNPSQ